MPSSTSRVPPVTTQPKTSPVSARWLDGGAQQVHSFNVMDVGTHRVALEPPARQKPVWLAQRLIAAWRRLGIPQVIQLDNHSNLRGAIGNPRRFGPVVATALTLGVTPRFVALSEPWRQGAIEHFRAPSTPTSFGPNGLATLTSSPGRPTSSRPSTTPATTTAPWPVPPPNQTVATANLDLAYPPESFQPPTDLPDHGRIEAIRFIRSDGILNLFNEHIVLPDGATHGYVTATIFLPSEQLVVTDTDDQILFRRHHPLA